MKYGLRISQIPTESQSLIPQAARTSIDKNDEYEGIYWGSEDSSLYLSLRSQSQ